MERNREALTKVAKEVSVKKKEELKKNPTALALWDFYEFNKESKHNEVKKAMSFRELAIRAKGSGTAMADVG